MGNQRSTSDHFEDNQEPSATVHVWRSSFLLPENCQLVIQSIEYRKIHCPGKPSASPVQKWKADIYYISAVWVSKLGLGMLR